MAIIPYVNAEDAFKQLIPQDTFNTRLNAAMTFLSRLDDQADSFTFQTFSDRKNDQASKLSRIFHGSIEDYFSVLDDLNQQGAGVFVCINETNGKGRKKDDIQRVRAVWQEDDGKGVVDFPLEPQLVIQTSPGHFHRYFMTDGGDDFNGHQSVMQTMVEKYGSDPNAKDISRVMRLPGFFHMKDPDCPYLVSIQSDTAEQPYEWDMVKTYFGSSSDVKKKEESSRTSTKASDQDLVDQIITAENYHDPILSLSGRMVHRGFDKDAVILKIQTLLEASTGVRDNRWHSRFNDIPRVVDGAFKKGFGDMGYEWPEPKALLDIPEPLPYPIDKFPQKIRNAIKEVQGYVKAPVAMVASSALSTLSLAMQHLIDVSRDCRMSGPVSLFFLTIADSGERKSSVDKFFMKPIRDYEKAEAKEHRLERKKLKAEHETWEISLRSLKNKLADDEKGGKDSSKTKKAIEEHFKNEPMEQRSPKLIYNDVTTEELSNKLANKWPSAGIISSEAGLVFGSHSMDPKSVMRTLALQNILWDGGSHTIDRRTNDDIHIQNARLTVSLQIQSETLENFSLKNGGLMRGMGFMARFLISKPQSLMGSRTYSTPPNAMPSYDAFCARVSELIAEDADIDELGGLSLIELKMDSAAHESWVRFFNDTEQKLRPDEDFYDVRDFVSKAAENVARLAALFEYFEGTNIKISQSSIEAASAIVTWHIHEAIRYTKQIPNDVLTVNALNLEKYLIGVSKDFNGLISHSLVMQKGPAPIRNKSLSPTADLLIQNHRIRLIPKSGSKFYQVNPALLTANPAN